MLKNGAVLNSVLMVLFLLLLKSPQVYGTEVPVTIATGEYPPWVSESAPHGGFVNHVIVEAFRRQNLTVHFQFLPWKRAYKLAREGKFHATSFWADNQSTREKHAEHFYKSDAVMNARVVFFYLKKRPMAAWETLNDLKRYRIGSMIGETSTEILLKNGIDVSAMPQADQAFMMILFNRIDIFPLELLTGLETLYFKLGPDRAALFAYHPLPLFETPASLLFSKKHMDGEKMVMIFNQGLSEMKKDGTFNKFHDSLTAGEYSQIK